MKKLTSLTALVILVALSLFFACQKSNLPNEDREKKSTNLFSTLSEDECERLNFDEVNIGEMHNQYVIDAYKNTDFSDPESVPGQLNQYFENLEFDVSALDVTREEFNALVHQYNDQLAACNYDIRGCEANVLNDETFAFIRQILDEGENMTDLESYYTTLDEIQEAANNQLTCGDLDAVTGTIIIAKKSAWLWAPEEMGGYDLYTKTFGEGPEGGRILLSWWKRAFIGDVSASSQYFLGMGVGLAAGLATPGTNAAILGGWAISAGLGSAFAALGL